MTDRPGAPSLDPELIVAYAEGRLSAAEAEAVEIQLAANPDDHALLVQIMKVADALPPEPTRIAEPATHRSRWWLSGAALAAAAVLVLAVLPVMRRGSSPGVSPELTRLVTAVGEARYVEPRLTGGFQFGPLRQIQRDSSQDLAKANLELYAAAAASREAAERDPQASRLVAWGIAQVLTHEFDGAIETLQRAAASDTTGGANANLAAAYLSRNGPQDATAALAAADSALRQSPRLVEALFNRALALGRLGRSDNATQAWQQTIDAEPNGLWADEARSRRATVASRP